MLVVAALLLTSLTKVAAAADNSERTSEHAQKLLVTLNALGINSSEVQNFVSELDTHVHGGYLSLGQTHVAGGALELHLQLQSAKDDPLGPHGGGINKMELRYAPNDSPIEAVARPDRVMIGWRLRF